jgi:isopenicillin-N epimerase
MPNALSRRTFLGGAVATLASLPAPAAPSAKDEEYWATMAAQYEVSPDFINLENAYYGIMAKPVMADFKRNIDKLNRDSSRFLRREFDRDGMDAIRAQLARHLGAAEDEIALTRSATESLQNLIVNYSRLRKGDTIMYADLDYDAMQFAMEDLALRSEARVAIVRIPEPASKEAVLDAYDAAMRANPGLRLLLLTHISHRTGLVMPVEELTRMAKQRGVDVILDVAQSWGQIGFRLSDMQADFIGGNLHKWIGAPLGIGFLYIRKARLADISSHMGNGLFPANDVRSRVYTGTVNAAALMTIPAALHLHEQIGAAAKGARLRYLRDHWVHQLRGHERIQILTPDSAYGSGAVTSFRIAGKTTPADNAAISQRLMDEFGIFTVVRHGPVGGSCVRVTPALFTRPADLDKLVAAVRRIA